MTKKSMARVLVDQYDGFLASSEVLAILDYLASTSLAWLVPFGDIENQAMVVFSDESSVLLSREEKAEENILTISEVHFIP